MYGRVADWQGLTYVVLTSSSYLAGFALRASTCKLCVDFYFVIKVSAPAFTPPLAKLWMVHTVLIQRRSEWLVSSYWPQISQLKLRTARRTKLPDLDVASVSKYLKRYHFSWASDCLCALSMCTTSLVCGGGVTLTGWWQLNCNYLREGGCGFNTSWGVPCNACLACAHCLLLCLLLCCVCCMCVVLYCTCPCVHCR